MSQTFDRFASSEQPNQATTFPPPKKSGCGCWLVGCLVIVLLLLILIAVSGFFAYRYSMEQIQKYTAETPVVLPEVVYTEDEMQRLNDRMESFKTDVNVGQETAEIELSAEDINALISQSKDAKGIVFVRTENDKLTCDVSIPLDGVPLANGRFLNGSATLDARMKDGKLFVGIEDVEVKGEKLPEVFVQSLQDQNLVESLDDNPDLEDLVDRVEDFRIENGKVYLKLRADMQAPSADPSSADGSDAENGADNADGPEIDAEN